MFIIGAVWGAIRTAFTSLWGFLTGYPTLTGVLILIVLAAAFALVVADEARARQEARDALADEIAAALLAQAAAGDDPSEELDAAEEYLGRSR